MTRGTKRTAAVQEAARPAGGRAATGWAEAVRHLVPSEGAMPPAELEQWVILMAGQQ